MDREQISVTSGYGRCRAMIIRMRRALCGILLLAWVGSIAAAQDDLSHDDLLARFKQAIGQALSQIPNYTCLETIQRSAQGPRAKSFSPLDTVLLEVSNLGGKELLSWPGARRFEDADRLRSSAAG